MNPYVTKYKNMEDCSREELLAVIKMYEDSHFQMRTISDNAEIKKLTIENNLLKNLIKK